MSTNEFDRILNEKFDEHEFVYNPVNWEKLSGELPKERQSRRLLPWLTGVAASVALLAGGYWFFNNAADRKNDVVKNEPETEATANPISPTPVSTEPDNQEEKSASPDPLQNIIPIQDNVLVNNHKPSNKAIYKQQVNTITKETKNTSANTPANPNEKNLLPFIQDPVATPDEKIVINNTPNPASAKPVTDENLNNPIFFDESKPRERKTSISLAGGFNFGSFNAGYGAAVNAKQKIGRKLFLEGDLGFLQNQEVVTSSMSTSQFNTVNSGGTRGRPAKLEEKPSNIHYVQMSPSIGYQLNKNVAVGIGADVQKLLDGNNDDRPVITTEEGFKLVPLWDAGITGKTEYTISKRLKAGILYREGINNLMQGDNRYFERRYLQVQMKLKLFGK